MNSRSIPSGVVTGVRIAKEKLKFEGLTTFSPSSRTSLTKTGKEILKAHLAVLYQGEWAKCVCH